MKLCLSADRDTALQVVCIGAHCDDIEIGCGGSLLALAQAYPKAVFHAWVFSGEPRRAAETAHCLSSLVGTDRLRLKQMGYRDGYFPADWSAIKESLRALSATVQADLVFTHTTGDAHQDHRTLAELTWNHFRNHLILEYQIVKYEGDLPRCNTYLPLSADQMKAKVDALMQAFPSQAGKHWFSAANFEAIARLRGIESHAPDGFAEAFVVRKSVLSLS